MIDSRFTIQFFRCSRSVELKERVPKRQQEETTFNKNVEVFTRLSGKDKAMKKDLR